MNSNNKRFDQSQLLDQRHSKRVSWPNDDSIIDIDRAYEDRSVQGPELFSHESVLTSPRFVAQIDQSLEPESLSLE